MKGPAPAADDPLVQLTLVRFREFMREPEALFWVFVFPILLAAGLGLGVPQPPGGSAAGGRADPAAGARAGAEKGLSVEQLVRNPRRSKRCAPAKWRWWPRPAPAGR